MKNLKRILAAAFTLVACMTANADMVAITINNDIDTAVKKHKEAGAKLVQVISTKDKNYGKVVRATYRDNVSTYYVTDAVPTGKRKIAKQVIVSKSSDALRGLGTWFNQQNDYKIDGADKWKTEVDGEPVMIYFAPVNNYGEGIIIERERFK